MCLTSCGGCGNCRKRCRQATLEEKGERGGQIEKKTDKRERQIERDEMGTACQTSWESALLSVFSCLCLQLLALGFVACCSGPGRETQHVVIISILNHADFLSQTQKHCHYCQYDAYDIMWDNRKNNQHFNLCAWKLKICIFKKFHMFTLVTYKPFVN